MILQNHYLWIFRGMELKGNQNCSEIYQVDGGEKKFMVVSKSSDASDDAGSILPFQVRRTPRGPVKSSFSTIRDLAREFDVTLRALRFYEAKGLLRPIRQGATRIYTAKDKVRLELILTGKTLGFTLTEIGAMLDEAGEDGASLRLSPALLLQQIKFLEEQHRTTLAALAELRRRYYILTDAEPCADNPG